MKINCGPSPYVRRRNRRIRESEWHEWFAWRPVRLGENDCRWLETVMRKKSFWAGQHYQTEYTEMMK